MKHFKSRHQLSFTLLAVPTPHDAWQPDASHPVTVGMYVSIINRLVNSAPAHAYKRNARVNSLLSLHRYTSSFDLLDELLPDFFPVCCDSDGDVLQVSLHLSITLWAERLEREHTSLQLAFTHAQGNKD
ncbi:unnamed protein product [Leuciscus chuanchicus]